jgi:hypothetical protein
MLVGNVVISGKLGTDSPVLVPVLSLVLQGAVLDKPALAAYLPRHPL